MGFLDKLIHRSSIEKSHMSESHPICLGKPNANSGILNLNIALEKLVESRNDFQYIRDYTRVSYAEPWFEPYWFRCSCCGKRTCVQVMYDDRKSSKGKEIYNSYSQLTRRFTNLGYPASFKALCNECVKKYSFFKKHFYSENFYKEHNYVFFVSRPDYSEPIYSFPITHRLDELPYKTALAFLEGADSISKISEITQSMIPAADYIQFIQNILFKQV